MEEKTLEKICQNIFTTAFVFSSPFIIPTACRVFWESIKEIPGDYEQHEAKELFLPQVSIIFSTMMFADTLLIMGLDYLTHSHGTLKRLTPYCMGATTFLSGAYEIGRYINNKIKKKKNEKNHY